MSYETPHILRGPYGNNAFSYDLRAIRSLHVPALRDGNFSDVCLGDAVVFEDRDDRWVLRSCTGLRYFIRTTFEGVPAIVFDNHNHALYFWYEALEKEIVSRGSTLVHIDEHSDLWENEEEFQVVTRRPQAGGGGDTWKKAENNGQNGIDLDEIFRFANYSCNVGNYIQPALREGMVGKMIRIEWEGDMDRHGSYHALPDESLILNLDLDFFAPELDYIPFESKKACILYFARQARLITIATSPFFIDQDWAIEMMRSVFSDL